MAITVSGGGGTVLVFTVEGNAAGNYAKDFANAVAGLNPVMLSGATIGGAANQFNLLDSNTASVNSYTLNVADQYTFIGTLTDDTITLAASGETVAAGFATTVVEQGSVGGERVIFTGGNNTFDGSTIGGAGDTISGGFGADTINTGVGNSTVFTGAGSSSVTLNDSVGSGGDVAIMTGVNAKVVAAGYSDTVFAFGSGTVVGGAGGLIFSSITDPSGNAPLPVTIVGGSGLTDIYMNAPGSNVTFQGTGSTSTPFIVAGAGNETLNAASSSSGVIFYGDTAASASTDLSVTGGGGVSFWATGGGTEMFNVGSGSTDLFSISDVSGASITLADLSSASNYFLNFAGMSVSTEMSLVNAGTEIGGNLIVSLGNNATVEFLGVTASQVDSHLI
jgi:hypothetical protein